MESNSDAYLGRRIKELRISMGLTQNMVAEELLVTPGYISNVENGRTAMSLRMLTYYAKLTHVTLDSLVGEMDPDYKDVSIDNEILRLTVKMKRSDKEKLIRTLKIWTE